MQKADKRADPILEDALERGYLNSGEAYAIDGFATHDAAAEGRLSISRSARRRNLSCGVWVTDEDGEQCYKQCKGADRPHGVRFRLFSKDLGRSHVFQATGGDPGKLKYNPWKTNRTDKFDDSGARIA